MSDRVNWKDRVLYVDVKTGCVYNKPRHITVKSDLVEIDDEEAARIGKGERVSAVLRSSAADVAEAAEAEAAEAAEAKAEEAKPEAKPKKKKAKKPEDDSGFVSVTKAE
jgi:septal ring factor EnvC (AmiA/AmiB activator)